MKALKKKLSFFSKFSSSALYKIKTPFSLRQKRRFSYRSFKIYLYAGFLSFLIIFCVYGYKNNLHHALVNYIDGKVLKFLGDTDFKIKNIHIDGLKYISEKTVLNALNTSKGQGILDHSIQDLKNAIQNLTWVKKVSVQRRLPHDLFINITERHPIAHYEKKGFIDEKGLFFKSSPIKSLGHLPSISGVGAPKVAPYFLRQLQQFPSIFKRSSKAIYVGKRRWDLILDKKYLVQLPEGPILKALDKLKVVLKTKIVKNGGVKIIDLRNNDKIFLKPF